MNGFDNFKNFGASKVANAPDHPATGTGIGVTAGTGVLFPSPPFMAVVWQKDVPVSKFNAEVVRVITVVGDNFEVLRQQEGSLSRNIVVGDQIQHSVTAKAFTDLQEVVGLINQPNSTFRFKDGQLQVWDIGYAESDPSKPWAAVVLNNGVWTISSPIAE